MAAILRVPSACGDVPAWLEAWLRLREAPELVLDVPAGSSAALGRVLACSAGMWRDRQGLETDVRAPRLQAGFGLLGNDARRKMVELAFADAGVGFHASLQRNAELAGRVADDAQALELALCRGVSGAPPGRGNAGMGLALLQDLADELEADLWLASGEALLHRRSVGQVRSSALRATPRWDGSWICLRARLG